MVGVPSSSMLLEAFCRIGFLCKIELLHTCKDLVESCGNDEWIPRQAVKELANGIEEYRDKVSFDSETSQFFKYQ